MSCHALCLLPYLSAMWTVTTAGAETDRAPNLTCGNSATKNQSQEESLDSCRDCVDHWYDSCVKRDFLTEVRAMSVGHSQEIANNQTPPICRLGCWQQQPQ